MVTNNLENSQSAAQDVEIPNKKYFMIGEVAKMCGVKTHVLRYWEGQFPQLKPSKRRGRRYYQRNDVLLILQINDLLNAQRFTVEGAIAQLSDKNAKSTSSEASFVPSDNQTELPCAPVENAASNIDLLGLVGSLKSLLKECQSFQSRVKEHL